MIKITKINTQRALSPTQISIAPCVINPFRGCAYGCLYCYVKNNKVFKNKKQNWGRFLEVKTNLSDILKEELKTKKPSRVLIGSVCEPFLKEKDTFSVTRQILEILNNHNVPYTILTRSINVKYYIDLISINPNNKIYFTVNFLDINTKKKFEPFIDYDPCELPDLFKLLKDNNINFRIHISPAFPFIVDIDKTIDTFKDYTNEFFIEGYNPLMGSWKTVRQVIQSTFGDVSSKIINIYETKEGYLEYTNSLKNQITTLQNKYNKQILSLIPDYESFYNKSIIYETPSTP